jgi:azurin
MYQQLLASILIATSPLLPAAALAQTTGTQKPASPTTQKPAEPGTQKPSVPSTQKPATAAGKTASKGVRTVEIIGTDDMKFSVANIAAKPGEQIRIRLITKSAMPKIAMAHNFVLLQKGASQVKFVTASAQARETDFIAPEMKDQVLAFTPLAGGGETVETVFKVPAAAGEYPYLCSFPGHFQAGMRGTLTVK